MKNSRVEDFGSKKLKASLLLYIQNFKALEKA